MEAGTDDLQEGETVLTESEKKDPHESFLEYCREEIFAGTLGNFRCVGRGDGISQFYPKNQENMAGENGNSQDFIIVKIEEGNMGIIIQDIPGQNMFTAQVDSLTEWIEGLEKKEKREIRIYEEFRGRIKTYIIPQELLKKKINGSNDTIFSKLKKRTAQILHLLV